MIKEVPYLTEEMLSGFDISTLDVIEAIESFLELSQSGAVCTAPKSVIVPPDGRYLMSTLAASKEPSLLMTKSLVLNPENPAQGRPLLGGLVTLLDGKTGTPLALLDCNWITDIRTAGLSAVAAKHLARPGASVAAFVGCGAQARRHLVAFSEMFPLTEVRLLGRGAENISKMTRLATGLGLRSIKCSSGKDLLAGADLVVSSVPVTTPIEPFLNPDDLSEGCFVSILDHGVPWQKEKLGLFDQIVIDDLVQEATFEKKLIEPKLVDGDLAELVLKNTIRRAKSNDRAAFLFRGTALGDIALSSLAFHRFKTLSALNLQH